MYVLWQTREEGAPKTAPAPKISKVVTKHYKALPPPTQSPTTSLPKARHSGRTFFHLSSACGVGPVSLLVDCYWTKVQNLPEDYILQYSDCMPMEFEPLLEKKHLGRALNAHMDMHVQMCVCLVRRPNSRDVCTMTLRGYYDTVV